MIYILIWLHREASKLSCCPMFQASQVLSSKILELFIGKGRLMNDMQTPSLLYFLCVCHMGTCCFVWDKDGISDCAAEQPLCGSPSKPALRVGINSVDLQIKLLCSYSFSISKSPLSIRNFPPSLWQGKAFL